MELMNITSNGCCRYEVNQYSPTSTPRFHEQVLVPVILVYHVRKQFKGLGAYA